MSGSGARLACPACGSDFPEETISVRCRSCGGLLEVRHPKQTLDGEALRQLFDSRVASEGSGSGVWRFREMVLSTDTPVSYPEGNTPLVSREAISAWVGCEVLLKHEGLNPTGSFKDRGMTVGVTQARRLGVSAVACASTGNTAASLAAYAAQAGLRAIVLVPSGQIARGKLAQAVGFGAQVVAVRGDFDACLAMVEDASARVGLYLLNSVNPYRLEGQKTIIFELLQQLGWKSPDWIVLPGGNLGNTAAFGKALEEARDAGLLRTARNPRIAVVQADGAAPFAGSFAGGFQNRLRVNAETVATAIRIGNPASWDRAVRAIRWTDGVVISVPDEEILAAKAIIDRAGVGCEPASAASVAGLRRLVRDGLITEQETVVAILTGHMLKDPETLLQDHRVLEIDPTVSALEQALER